MALYTVTRMSNSDPTYPLFQVNRRTAAGTEVVIDYVDSERARDAAKGLATGQFASVEEAKDALAYNYGADVEPEYVGCECEQDWNCPLHQHRAGTWIETRYDHLIDADERGF